MKRIVAPPLRHSTQQGKFRAVDRVAVTQLSYECVAFVDDAELLALDVIVPSILRTRRRSKDRILFVGNLATKCAPSVHATASKLAERVEDVAHGTIS